MVIKCSNHPLKSNMFSWVLCLLYTPLIFCEVEDKSTTLLPEEEFKCTLPDVKTIDDNLDLSRFRSDFSKISENYKCSCDHSSPMENDKATCMWEVKFPGLIGPLNERLICKIKCIDGNWVGPLCSNTPDGRFQPILRECMYRNDHPLLAISFKNSSIDKDTSFPHGSLITARCKHFGHYKIKGESTMRCENGEWSPKMPECVPTTLITNFTGDVPPTIQYTVVSGSAVVDPAGELLVFPESAVRLDCVTPRPQGDPEWSWTQALGHSNAAWSPDEGESETHYRLTLSKMSARHSGQYTCATPQGHTNTITIKVVNVSCPPLNASTPHLRQFAQGSKLGHAAHFSCQPGHHLNGSALLTCMGDGRWSSPPPTCVETFCPVLGTVGPHLSVVEYNSSFGGRAVFQCSWGYRLVGNPGLECEQDGTWSGAVPHCTPIYCPEPIVPENGRIISGGSKLKHHVGDLIIYSCDEGFHIAGESSIVCTETGFWSHPPPFCLIPTDHHHADTIYIENTTFVHFNEQV